MTLTNFEALVEAKIVERGYDYYKRERIARVEQVGEGEFSAVVYGSESYDVYVKTDGERIVEYGCDCPYDWGDTCKHAVGVFYRIRYGNFTGGQADKFSSILQEASNEHLRDFVLNLLKRDGNFRRKFLREFDESFAEDDEDYPGEDYPDEDYY